MSTANAEQLLSQLKGLVPAGTTPPSDSSKLNLSGASETLKKLKLELLKYPAASPPFAPEQMANVKKVMTLQREMLEYACFLSLYSKDTSSFDRYLNQLKVFYTDYSSFLTPSAQQGPVLGCYLLYLLAQNQIADFHTEYELLCHAAHGSHSASSASSSSSSGPVVPPSPTSSTLVSSNSLLSSAYIKFPIQLEQQLMEGCYNQILTAKQTVPLPLYSFFMDTLSETVRRKIADCSEEAYESLTIPQIQKLLLLSSPEETLKFISTRKDWKLTQGNKAVSFHLAKKNEGGAGSHQNKMEIPALKIIKQQLEYATELERIV